MYLTNIDNLSWFVIRVVSNIERCVAEIITDWYGVFASGHLNHI